jgi:hypothetical protein
MPSPKAINVSPADFGVNTLETKDARQCRDFILSGQHDAD